MRKTTDPREHKYLVDREFNTFGRGAVEDAPAELLYGHGALSRGFNVNCYNQYFEGRSGSRLFSRARVESVLESGNCRREWVDGVGNAVVPDDPDLNMSLLKNREIRYVDWLPAGAPPSHAVAWSRDVFTGNYSNAGLYIESGDRSNNGALYGMFRGKPALMTWHSILNVWVRIESGRLHYTSWNMVESVNAQMDLPRFGWNDGGFA